MIAADFGGLIGRRVRSSEGVGPFERGTIVAAWLFRDDEGPEAAVPRLLVEDLAGQVHLVVGMAGPLAFPTIRLEPR